MDRLFLISSEDSAIRFGGVILQKQIKRVLDMLGLHNVYPVMDIYEDDSRKQYLYFSEKPEYNNIYYPLTDLNCCLGFKLFEPYRGHITFIDSLNTDEPLAEDDAIFHKVIPNDKRMYLALHFKKGGISFLSKKEEKRRIVCNATNRIEGAFIASRAPYFYTVSFAGKKDEIARASGYYY